MRNKVLIIYSFVLSLFVLWMPGNIFAQDDGKDYINFSSSGRLLSFKKTAPDGSSIEVLNETPGTSPYYYYLTVHCSDGELLEAFLYTRDAAGGVSIGKDYIYKYYVEKAKSFDTAVNDLYCLRSYSDEKQAVCRQPSGLTLFYKEGSEFRISAFSMVEPNGDYMKCSTNSDYSGPLRYFNASTLRPEMIGQLKELRKTFNDYVINLSVSDYSERTDCTINYKNGNTYEGAIAIEGADIRDWKYWGVLEEQPVIKFTNGVLITPDKKYKAYENGEYSEFESIRVTQSRAKKEAEEKAEAEAIRKATEELNKKYGEKYVNAMLNGELPLGTPEDLFLLGVKIKAYSFITSVDLVYRSKRTSEYNIYGWSLDTSNYVMLSNSTLLGYITFTNGVLSSASILK